MCLSNVFPISYSTLQQGSRSHLLDLWYFWMWRKKSSTANKNETFQSFFRKDPIINILFNCFSGVLQWCKKQWETASSAGSRRYSQVPTQSLALLPLAPPRPQSHLFVVVVALRNRAAAKKHLPTLLTWLGTSQMIN